MKFTGATIISFALTACLMSVPTLDAFLPRPVPTSRPSMNNDLLTLNAISVLVKKAKQAALKEYVQNGVEESVMAKYNLMKEKMETADVTNQSVGPLQQALTKRKGTITVIAEYKRKNSFTETGKIKDIFAVELMSPVFREFGAAAIAVMADERMGGCNYDDLAHFVEEQRRAKSQVPGPVAVINNDLVIDELQIARTAAYGAAGCVINFSVVGEDELSKMLKAAKVLDLEVIVAVSTNEEAQTAIDLGARIVSVIGVSGVDEKMEVIADLTVPEGQQVCLVANILAKNDKSATEIEEAWALRDKGFNCVWVGEALYKPGAETVEHPGAVIKNMRSKASLKWASPNAGTGRGEGAREYLGDILM